MTDENKVQTGVSKEITLKDIIRLFKELWAFLLSKWVMIVIFGISGGIIGLGMSFLIKPKYTAHLSFVLLDKSSGGGGLASLASSFGLVGLMGSGSDNAFSGDNLLEIIKSRYAVEKALLMPINFDGEKMSMMDAYIKFNKLDEDWAKSKDNIELRTLKFPYDQDRNTYSRTQDSVMYNIYKTIIDNNDLVVLRKNKKIGMVNVDFTSANETFSKLFVENLMDQTYTFYKDTRTAQSRVNLKTMQHTADSIRNLYESALYGSARVSQENINRAMQYAVVPKIKEEYNVQLYGAVYAEVLKNLETIKLDMEKETPIIQIIDHPKYPLKKTKLGKIKGIAYGGIAGGGIIVLWLLVSYYWKKYMK